MIEKYLLQKKCKARFLIGPNGSGKSYSMRKVLKNHEGESLFITEEGNLDIRVTRKKVDPDLDNHIYIIHKEKAYGSGKDEYETVDIDDRLNSLLIYCKEQIDYYDGIKFKSKGQEKISNIFNLLYKTMLNPIKIIFFDEPENYLDDMGLRKISKMFSMIEKAKIKLIISSHNFNLCTMLKIPVEHLLFVSKEFDQVKSVFVNNTKTINKKNIKSLYEDEAKNILDTEYKNKLDKNRGINIKLNYYKNTKIFDLFLDDVLYSEQFYRSLFYQNIYIVEGPTEKRIVSKMDLNDKLNSTFFFVANGKAFIPFYVKLFKYVGKNVRVVIDSDSIPVGKSTNQNTAYAITLYLQDQYGDDVIVFEPDLERHFGIDLSIYSGLVDRSCEKVYASDEFFQKKLNLNKFKKMIDK